jgi:hypothetical protein
MKLPLIAAAAAGIALSGCQSGKFDAFTAKDLPKACAGLAQVYSGFVIVAGTGKIKPDVVKKARAAWAAAEVICKDPASVNSSTAIVKVAEAYAALVAALR